MTPGEAKEKAEYRAERGAGGFNSLSNPNPQRERELAQAYALIAIAGELHEINERERERHG